MMTVDEVKTFVSTVGPKKTRSACGYYEVLISDYFLPGLTYPAFLSMILALFCKLAFFRGIGRAFEFNEVSIRVRHRHNPKAVANKRTLACWQAT